MAEDLTVVYSADNVHQANTLKLLLEERGIEAFVSNDALPVSGPVPGLGWSAPRVLVPNVQAHKARQLALQFEQQQRERSQMSDEVDDDMEDDIDSADAVWEEWPRCPRCGVLRDAVCPQCEKVGNNFSLAEYLDSTTLSDEADVRMICPNCDEQFSPRFCRGCEQCNYEWVSGVERPRELESGVNPRAVLLAFVLVLIGAGLLTYFASLVP